MSTTSTRRTSRLEPGSSASEAIASVWQACIALVAVFALGPTGTSAAPAVVPADGALYWSGIAATAITAGAAPISFDPGNPFNPGPVPLRPPASSSVLGAMVHGAMYDAVAAIEGGLEPFATGVTAPPGAAVERGGCAGGA